MTQEFPNQTSSPLWTSESVRLEKLAWRQELGRRAIARSRMNRVCLMLLIWLAVFSSDTRTPKQKESMKHLILDLHHRFPGIRTILGHRDLPGVQKACPCFDATKLQYLLDAS